METENNMKKVNDDALTHAIWKAALNYCGEHGIATPYVCIGEMLSVHFKTVENKLQNGDWSFADVQNMIKKTSDPYLIETVKMLLK